MYLDRYGFLAHNLTVTDRASMAESIEVRVPLLNPAIESFAWSLEDEDLLKGQNGKLPLKHVLEKHLSAEQVHRPKVGFNPPLDGRIRKIGQGLCEELVGTGPIADHLDPQWTRALVADHFAGRGNQTYRIWQLIYFRFWLEEMADFGGRA
jgi:asparagine synthase (glutamine-hydrolysing)